MTQAILRVLISVKAKLFLGFAAMTLLMAFLGGSAFLSIGSAGTVVKDTFDKPLMAINFARSAGQVFATLEIEHLRYKSLDDPSSDERAAYDETVTQLIQTFRDDLNIAQERSIAPRADPFFEDTLAEFEGWIAATAEGDVKTEQVHTEAIVNNLDIIIELQTNQSFRARESALSRMDRITALNLWAVAIALGLTIGLSTWLGVTIIRPLRAAAIAARKISAGDLNTPIPDVGDDETGALLKSMAVMQTNLRYRMEREKELRSLAQTRLIDALENSSDAIVLTDANGRVIVANPRVRDLISSDADKLIGQSFLERFHFDGRPKNNDEDIHLTKDKTFKLGRDRWFRINTSETRDGGNLFIWTDVTESHLQTHRLRRARDEAQSANIAKTNFLAAMSHELRTPLNAVIGFADVLHARADALDETKSAELASLISTNGSHLLNIVQDVLFLADDREEERMALNMEPLDLRDIIDRAMHNMMSKFGEAGLKPVWTRPKAPAWVHGDGDRLHKAFLNLLGNAVKYNRAQGGVMARLSDAGDTWRVDFVDTGIGMSTEELKQVRDVFAQADQGHSRKYNGLGIGINLVDRIVSGHDGRVHIQSRVNYGTTVSLMFPKLQIGSQTTKQALSSLAA